MSLRGFRLARSLALLICVLLLATLSNAQGEPEAPGPAVTRPEVLSEPTVRYPDGATGDATVVLIVTVSATGEVSSVAALEDNEPFSSHAIDVVRRWLFKPATRDGVPAAAKIRVEVPFRAPSLPPPEVPRTGTAAPGAATPTEAPEAALPAEDTGIIVRGKRPDPSRSATLARAEVREIPGTFGDPFRAIEALPGVTPIVSGLPFFFVRGAPPGNVGYYLDGIRVPVLFHVGVGPSVVHPALVDRVDLYPGGYPARYGRFAGGIVSGETRRPEASLRGEYNLRLFDAGALAEVPFDGGRGAVLAGGRYSYTALLFTLLSPETVLDYWDYQARVSYDLTPEDTLEVFSFGSYDYLGERAETETLTLFSTEFHRVDVRYDRRLGGRGTLRTAFMGGIDRSAAQQDRFVRDRVAGARTELDYRVSDDVLLRAGTDLQLDHYDVELGIDDLSPSAEQVSRFFPSRTDVVVGTRADAVLAVDRGFEVTPGVRVDLYGSDGATAVGVDPRLAARTAISDRLALLLALGIAHQPPAFVVPLPGFQPGGLRGGLQRAVQESIGLELDLGEATTFTATVFQNAFFDMSDPLGTADRQVEGCPPGSFPGGTIGGDLGRQPRESEPCDDRFPRGTLGPDRSGGGGQGADGRFGRDAVRAFEVRTMGSAYGLELFLKKRMTDKLGGFLTYTLSRSIRHHGRRSYVATFDRTHVTNAALAYDLGKRWRAGTRVIFYTGLPKAPDPTDPDSTRLPPFFRIDLRLEKKWRLGRTTWISAIAEWMNATLSKEAVATTCTLSGCEAEEVGPITIPSIGIEGGF